MSSDLDLEQRYRRVLRLLPGYYRDKWEEDMLAAFLDSWLTGDPEEDEAIIEFCRPTWPEVASVAGLAARLYLGGRGAPRRYFAWGQAVRGAVLAVVLVHSVRALDGFVRLAWTHRLLSWLPAAPVNIPTAPSGGILPTTFYAVGCAWIVIFAALVLGHYRTARVLAALAIVPYLVALLRAELIGSPLPLFGAWAFWVLLDLAPVLAMAAFYRDVPAAARRPWLLALPASYLLVAVPLLAVQATGNFGWLPDFPGLCCILVTLVCPGPRTQGLVPRGGRLGRVVAGPDPARRRRWALPDRLARELPARPAPDRGKPGGTAHPGGRRRAGRSRRRPRPDSHARTATISAAGMKKRWPTQEDPGHAVPAPVAPVVRPGQRSGRGRPHAHRGRLQPADPARADTTAAQPSGITDRPASHAQPAGHAHRPVSGRLRRARHAGQPDPGLCYRKLGTPVTITSAAVSPVIEGPTTTPAGPQARSGSTPVGQARPVSGQARPVSTPVSGQARPVTTPVSQQAPPVPYGFAVAVPAADVAAVTAVITRAYDSRGAIDISVAGKTWAAPHVIKPFPGRQFQIFLPSRNQALQLRRILVPPS